MASPAADSGNVGLVALVDLHVPAAADGELQAVETDPLQIGNPAECGEHDVGGQHCAAAQLHLHLGEPVEARTGDFGATLVLAAHRLKTGQEPLAQRRVEKSQRLRRLVDQGYGAAERRENRRVLAGDHTAAQHHHGARYVRQAQNGIAVQNVFVIDLDAGHMPRP